MVTNFVYKMRNRQPNNFYKIPFTKSLSIFSCIVLSVLNRISWGYKVQRILPLEYPEEMLLVLQVVYLFNKVQDNILSRDMGYNKQLISRAYEYSFPVW